MLAMICIRQPIRMTLCLLVFAACSDVEEQPPLDSSPIAAEESSSAIFVGAASQTGLDFVHFNGMSGEHYIVEMMGAGAALFDYDNDGDLDVYLVQGMELGAPRSSGEATVPSQHSLPLTDRLYRNDLDPNTHKVQFTDVTGSSGVLGTGYGMGVAAADYDNDGWIDLYVTNYGNNQLLRNRGDLTFEDATEGSGADDQRWSVAATFLDFDQDGWLDLYVGNYIRFSTSAHTPCPTPSGLQSYCGPGAYPPQHDSLWRNRANGTFEEVSRRAGVRTNHGAATLGVVAADFDADGWIDIYVANDSTANKLWMNQGGGRFSDRALLAGVAVNKAGQPEASMGVDAADYDGDGDLDLFLAHLSQESNTLYRNGGDGLFDDASTASGLAIPSMASTAFGTAWLDYDNDSKLDLLAVNGAVVGIESLLRAGDPFPLHQTNQLFRNMGSGSLDEVTMQAGEAFMDSMVSRGAAFGDIDNDGDTDVVIVNNNDPVRLLLNQKGQNKDWVGLRLIDQGRDALGAEVVVTVANGEALLRRVHTDGSYASSSDPRVLVGLGDFPGSEIVVEVRWSDGAVEQWENVPTGQYTALWRGSGDNPQL